MGIFSESSSKWHSFGKLEVGEALPTFHLVEVKEGTYSDSIVATITDNPDPVEFQLASIGALPKVP